MLRLFFMHVRSGIHMNQKANTGNDQQEKRRKLIDLESKRNTQFVNVR